jgi:hypothetical protein
MARFKLSTYFADARVRVTSWDTKQRTSAWLASTV